MKGKILVACVGNIFLGDDAFGVEVAQQLTRVQLPDDIVVKDFGIRSYDLAYALMDEWDLVILVDALPQGGMPGTVYILEPEIPTGSAAPVLDAHSMNPVSVLQLVGALGGRVGKMLVVGCEPDSVNSREDGELKLSPPVQAAAEEAVRLVQQLVNRSALSKAA